MDRFGIRRVVACALILVAAGSGLTVLVRHEWELVLCWRVLVGLGTGSMALVFAATIASRWFVKRRGLVMCILTAGNATGQLILLPILAAVSVNGSWRLASLIMAAAALAVVPLVLLFLHNQPSDRGVRAYGESDADLASGAEKTATGAEKTAIGSIPATLATNSARRAIQVFAMAAHHRTFWALMAGFAICGATTNGLIGTNFIPAAHYQASARQRRQDCWRRSAFSTSWALSRPGI